MAIFWNNTFCKQEEHRKFFLCKIKITNFFGILMVLRRIFGPKRDVVTREWRKLHNKELHDLYSSPSIIRIIKSRRMRWAGHVA
jgi:hypothetical protein